MEEDHLFELNYAITLALNEELDKAREHFAKFEALFGKLDADAKANDEGLLEQRRLLGAALGVDVTPVTPSGGNGSG